VVAEGHLVLPYRQEFVMCIESYEFVVSKISTSVS
jgi:hypothetical protein